MLMNYRRPAATRLALALLLTAAIPAGEASEQQRVMNLAKSFENHARAGRYAEATRVGREFLAAVEKNFGANHTNTAAVSHDLGLQYQQTGNFAKAEELYQRALRIWRKTLGSTHTSVGIGLSNLGVLYYTRGEYGKAESTLEEARVIFEKRKGSRDAMVGVIVNNLAQIYELVGDYGKAEASYVRAVSILEKASTAASAFSTPQRELVRPLTNLGALYMTRGQYAKSEATLQRAVTLGEKVLKDHPDLAQPLSGLASLYHAMGEYPKAEQALQRAIAIVEKKHGAEYFDVAMLLNNLALLAQEQEDYAKAEPLQRRALAISEKSFNAEHARVGLSLTNLGLLCRLQDKFDEAESLLTRAIEVQKKASGADHESTARAMNNLGLVYVDLGRYDKADELYRGAHEIFKKKLGPDHRATVSALENVAMNALRLGKTEEARTLCREVDAALRPLWNSMMLFTSESQRDAVEQLEIFQTLDGLGSLGDGTLLAEASLWRKGAVLESLLEDRRAAQAASADPKLASSLAEAESLKGRLRHALLEGNAGKLSTSQIAQLKTRVETVQKELARKISGLGTARAAGTVTLPAVQAALGSETVLVDFVRYEHELEKHQNEERYAATIIAGNGAPVFVQLGKAETIEKLIAQHREQAGLPLGESEDEGARNTGLEQTCRALHDAVAAPIEKALPAGVREVIVCPDGQMHFLAFASLLDAGKKFLGEKFVLRQVASGRDLVKASSWDPNGKRSAVLLANPNYAQVAAAPSTAKRGTTKRSTAKPAEAPLTGAQERIVGSLRTGLGDAVRSVSFSPLPGTVAEVEKLRPRFESTGWATQVVLGDKATEAALHDFVAPSVLHLATHGFFLEELELGKRGQRRGLVDASAEGAKTAAQDPMLRSGLALSGAQATVDLWREGKVPPLERDGILTAAEAAGLRLNGTYLVALSACETGLGEARSAEGVLGLKRGFAVAGAENLLITLWEISDEDTVALMDGFYERLLGGESPARALAGAQSAAFARLRQERGLFHAINRAAPFVVVESTAQRSAPSKP